VGLLRIVVNAALESQIQVVTCVGVLVSVLVTTMVGDIVYYIVEYKPRRERRREEGRRDREQGEGATHPRISRLERRDFGRELGVEPRDHGFLERLRGSGLCEHLRRISVT
jgi:hypothetical protein